MFNKPDVDRRLSFQRNVDSAPVVGIPSADANAKRFSSEKETFPLTGKFNKAYQGYQDEKKNEFADSPHEKGEKISEKWESFEKGEKLKMVGHGQKDVVLPGIANAHPPPYTSITNSSQNFALE